MTRSELLAERKSFVDHFESIGIECNWFMETGGVKMKRNGVMQFSFSLRNYKDDIHLANVETMKDIVKQKYPNVKFSIYNSIDSYRDEYRLICSI